MNKRIPLKKRELNKIRRALPVGWRDEISAQSGLSTSLVEKVMLGLRSNELIIQLSITLSSLPEVEKNLIRVKIDSTTPINAQS